MTAPVETTAAMTTPAEQRDPAHDGGSTAAGESARSTDASAAGVLNGAGEQAAVRRELSSNAVITLFGGLVTTLLAALIGLMMWQFNSLGARIDAQSDRIDSLGASLRAEMAQQGTELRAETADLRAEMAQQSADLRAEMAQQSADLRAYIAQQSVDLRAETTQLRTDLRAEMAQQGTELRAETADLRAEMQAGFAEVTAILLDHTDRLARLETAAGLPRAAD
ncbi:hypothetical protein [Candidatus Poriferisodalis sp.]|uniref:hypothetical protein n=1 Tax=Candidatus Poriferisodalis sp. TaxID=3101277 RepID=UPI003B01DAC9